MFVCGETETFFDWVSIYSLPQAVQPTAILSFCLPYVCVFTRARSPFKNDSSISILSLSVCFEMWLITFCVKAPL